MCGVLSDLARFCTRTEYGNILSLRGDPIPEHQDLLRDQKIIDIAVAMLDAAVHFMRQRLADVAQLMAEQPTPPASAAPPTFNAGGPTLNRTRTKVSAFMPTVTRSRSENIPTNSTAGGGAPVDTSSPSPGPQSDHSPFSAGGGFPTVTRARSNTRSTGAVARYSSTAWHEMQRDQKLSVWNKEVCTMSERLSFGLFVECLFGQG